MSGRRSLIGILISALALIAAPAIAAGPPATALLVNPHQLERERLAQRIMDRPGLGRALRRTEVAYAADPAAAPATGHARVLFVTAR